MKTQTVRPILVATDRGESSDAAVRQAGLLAAVSRAELHLITVVDSPLKSAPASGSVTATGSDEVSSARAELLLQARRCLPEGITPASVEAVEGLVYREILHRIAATDAALLVVGAHRGSAAGARVLGTTADQLVRSAGIPTLVVREPCSIPVHEIGIATDDTNDAPVTIRTALAFAEAFGGTGQGAEGDASVTVRVVHVGWPASMESEATGPRPRLADRMERHVERAIEERGAPAQAPVVVEVLWENRPSEAIETWVQERKIDVLVMRAGSGGFFESIFGNAASQLAHHGPAVTLLVPRYLRSRAPFTRDGRPVPRALDRVVIGVEFDQQAVQAAEWTVARFAPDAEHVLVHCVDEYVPPAYRQASLLVDMERRSRELDDANGRLQALAESLSGTRIETQLLQGRSENLLADVADTVDANLIVDTAARSEREAGALVRQAAERALRRSGTPVLFARPRSGSAPRRILAAVDDSDLVGEVLHWASWLGERFGAAVVAYHAYPLEPPPGSLLGGGAIDAGIDLSDPEMGAEVADWLGMQLRLAGLPPESAEVLVTPGPAEVGIIAAIGEHVIDLVVMGSRGAGGVSRFFFGSVAASVVGSAPCSVLVVPEPAAH